jgi:hypothetical protein
MGNNATDVCIYDKNDDLLMLLMNTVIIFIHDDFP